MNTTEHQLDLVEHIESLDSSTLYTLRQAMSLLNISRATIYRRLRDLSIVSHKIDGVGYLDQTMLDQLREIKRSVVPGTVSTSQPNDAVVTLLQEISDKMSLLIERIDQLPVKTASRTSNSQSGTSNRARAEKCRQDVIRAYLELKEDNRLPLNADGNVIYAQFSSMTGISRDAVSKYLKAYLSDIG